MRERQLRIGPAEILVDAATGVDWTAEQFTPAYWRRRGQLITAATGGRGAVVFVRAGTEEWALRHYLRGGLVRHVSTDRFLYQGRSRVRCFREWRLLREMFEAGLPVPRPVAAAYRRDGLSYSADIITRRIDSARPLAEYLGEGKLDDETWARLGACVRRFHDAGVWHADLNLNNLLLDRAGKPWMIDFDRGRTRRKGSWRQANLERLLRSLRKSASQDASIRFGPSDWRAFLDGYGQRPA